MLPAGTCGRARRLPRRRRSTAASRDEASRDEALQVETRRDEAGRGVATKSRIVLTWSRVGDEKETKSTCVSMSPPGNPLRPFTCQPPPGEKKKRTDVLVPSCRVELSRWSPIASLDGLSHASAQTHLVVRTAPPPNVMPEENAKAPDQQPREMASPGEITTDKCCWPGGPRNIEKKKKKKERGGGPRQELVCHPPLSPPPQVYEHAVYVLHACVFM